MRIAIIGAGGFVGRAVVDELASSRWPSCHLTLLDAVPFGAAQQAGLTTIIGDLADPTAVDRAIAGADAVIVLAAVLGGAAEADYALARHVNVDATLSLFEMLRRPASPPRVVFASSIAVFGAPLPDRVDDDTWPQPTMVYGAQKLMMEVALEHFSARGWLDGIALRYPGVVARDGADAKLKSAYLNRIFYAIRDGAAITLPVSPDARCWLASVRQTAWNTAKAVHLAPGAVGRRRAVTLPALHVSMAELAAALRRRFPKSSAEIHYAPDSALEAQFGRYPPLTTARAFELGFRADESLDALVTSALHAIAAADGRTPNN